MLIRLVNRVDLRERESRWLVAILALSLALNVYGVGWGLPFPKPPSWGDVRSNFWWAHDTIAPIGPVAAARDLFSWGTWSQTTETFYPLFHYMVLSVTYMPYMLYLLLTGQAHSPDVSGFPYGFSDPVTSLSVLTILANLVSALMATGVVALAYFTGKAQFGRRAGLLAAAIVAVCYTLVFYAHTSNLDVPYLFWFSLGLYAYVQAINTDRLRYFILFGVSAALATATKDQAYALFLAMPLPLLWFHYVHSRTGRRFSLRELLRSLADRKSLAALGSAVVTYVAANNLLFNFQRFVLHIDSILNVRNSDKVLDSSTWTGHVSLLTQTMYFIQHSLGMPLFLLCLVAALYTVVVHFRRIWHLLVPLVAYYLIFITASAFYVHARHVLPIVLVMAVLAGKGGQQILASTGWPRRLAAGAGAIAFAYAIPYAFSVDLTLLNDARFQATRWIENNVPPGASIEVYNRPDALPYLSDAYQVKPVDLRAEPSRVATTGADYIIVSERDYRSNANRPETERLAALLHIDSPLSRLIQGRLGYDVAAQFKYVLHAWFDPDILYTVNPRIIVLERAPGTLHRPYEGPSQ